MNKKFKIKTMGIIKFIAIVCFIIPPLFIFFKIYFSIKYENNPSSTSAIGYLVGPIIGSFYGFILSLVGTLFAKVLKLYTNLKRISIKRGIIVIFIVGIISSIIGSYTGYNAIKNWNQRILPKVLIKNEIIIKNDIDEFNDIEINDWKGTDNIIIFGERYKKTNINLENKTLEIRSPLKETNWNNEKVYLCFDNSNSYVLSKISKNKYKILLKYNIDNLSYITDVQGYEIEFDSKKYFVLLTVLRATLNRSYLTIYSNGNDIIYNELTGRIRIIKPVKFNDKNYLITGNERYPGYVYYWK